MGYIEEQIAEKFHTGELTGKNVVLFNCYHESRLAACALINRGITPKGIITPERKKENTSIWGIPVYTVNEFYKKFRRDAFVVIFEGDYFWWRGWFEGKGYYNEHKLLVTYANRPEENRQPRVLQRLLHRAEKFKQLWRGVRKIWLGYRTYCRLRKKYGAEMPIYVYDYDGLGDAYVFGALLKAGLGADIVVTVRKAGLKKVLDMFDMQHVEVLSEEESRALYKLMAMYKKPAQLHSMTPVPQSIHTDILWCLYGCRLNMLDLYKKYLELPLDGTIELCEPCMVRNRSIDDLFHENGIAEGKTIVLSPFSNSLVTFPYLFWKKLADSLLDMGFNIIMNCVGDEYVLPDTVALDYPLQDAPYVIEKAGFFVGVRSGFCDLVSNTDAVKIVISPKMEKVNFNGHIFDAFSFQGMRVGKKIIEFEWAYDDFDELIDKISVILEGSETKSEEKKCFSTSRCKNE